MEKFPLNSEGLTILLQQLYALPDNELNQEAASVVANFRLWLNEKFSLAASQVDYLNEIDDRFIAMAALESANSIGRRLAIKLIKADKLAARSEEAQDKVVKVHKEKKASYSSGGEYSEEEILTYEIMYE